MYRSALCKLQNSLKSSRKLASLQQLRPFGTTNVAKGEAAEAKPTAVQETDFSAPPLVRLHDTLPPHLRAQIDPKDEDFDAMVSIPSNFERSTGTERAEMVDSHVWDELLPMVIDLEKGHGSSLMNPIIINSLGSPERVVGCPGECYDGEDMDFEGVEWQYWVMKENHFAVCDDCGLVFFLASPEVITQMEIWEKLEDDPYTRHTSISIGETFNSKELFDLSAEELKSRLEGITDAEWKQIEPLFNQAKAEVKEAEKAAESLSPYENLSRTDLEQKIKGLNDQEKQKLFSTMEKYIGDSSLIEKI